MAKRVRFNSLQSSNSVCKFRQASFDLLTDFLVNLNSQNTDKLNSLSKCCGCFKDKNIVGYIFFMTEELNLDPQVGYHATELLQSFMTKHIIELLATVTSQGAPAAPPTSYEDAVLDMLKEKFPFIVFSCLQLASKMSLHVNVYQVIDFNAAVHFLKSLGYTATHETLLDSEMLVLKGLDFKLNVTNPLIYVEVLLEVLGHNEPSIPIESTYDLCQQVLQFVVLERAAIYDALLSVTTKSQQPSIEQREKFVTVTEDCMLLGVAVVAVALYIFCVGQWEKVVGELSNITGISKRSIIDFAHVTLLHIVDSSVL